MRAVVFSRAGPGRVSALFGDPDPGPGQDFEESADPGPWPGPALLWPDPGPGRRPTGAGPIILKHFKKNSETREKGVHSVNIKWRVEQTPYHSQC